jgi:tRNA A-37 threonylcarbamoyl transferase component Bud32
MAEAIQPGPSCAPSGAPAAGSDALVGRTLGDYVVVRRLGQGGMGQVFLADQLSLKRRVALKFLRPEHLANQTALKRFRAEAEAVARVTHANIVQVYAVGEADGMHYMALEYVEGRTLRDYLNKKGPLDVPVALSVMRQVAAALQRASESGIVHRDIKPENILLTRKGEVKVADFGLSRRVLQSDENLNLTQSNTTLGTPLYMSPEQVQGKPVDPRSDIYSFGVTCYHMLAGKPPFRGATAIEVALQHIQAEPPSLQESRPDLPGELVALVNRMMCKDPAGRPQTGREILRELAGVRGQAGGDNPFAGLTLPPPSATRTEPVPAAPTPAANPTVTAALPRRRPWTVLMLAGAVVMALLLGVGLRKMLSRESLLPPVVEDATPPPEPIMSDRERFLRMAVEQEQFTAPTLLERIREGAGYHVDLAVIYLDQRRYDKAEELFAGMTKVIPLQPAKPLVQHPYKLIGECGLAIVAAMRDEAEQSKALFEALYKRPQVRNGGLFSTYLPPETAVNFRSWLVTALDRNATREPLTKELEDFKVVLKNPPPPRLNPGAKNKAAKGK